MKVKLSLIIIPKSFRARHVHPKFKAYDRKSIDYHKRRIRQGKPSQRVDLTKVGEKYRIRDGFHRIKALKELGRKTVEANVS